MASIYANCQPDKQYGQFPLVSKERHGLGLTTNIVDKKESGLTDPMTAKQEKICHGLELEYLREPELFFKVAVNDKAWNEFGF